MKLLLVMMSLVSALFVRAVVLVDTCWTDGVKTVTFTDTVFDPDLPDVEILNHIYSNSGNVTTAGFIVILRGGEITITGADLYKASPEDQINRRMKTLVPLKLHLGDSSRQNMIRHVYVAPRFAYSRHFYGEDSLVIHTDRGDITLYLMEAYRERLAAKKIIDTLESTNRSLSYINHIMYAFVIILAVVIAALSLYLYRRLVRQKRERERLLAIISENEMENRVLIKEVTSQFRKNFETINKLCYEYFELADSPALKKSIYSQVEKEIKKLRDPDRLLEIEDSLNRYCDNIMVRISEQLPQLTNTERILLLYLYSGLSVRTICILAGIKVKSFYMRRQRLKSKILASSAPDRIDFADLM